MKKITLTLFITLILFSCKAQKRIIETKSKDVILFNIENSFFSILNNKYNQNVYSGNDFLIFTQNWTALGYNYFNKEYLLIRAEDTMNIKCNCGQERNFFFKNLEFQKGNFELIIDYSDRYNNSTKKYENREKYILGKQIRVLKEVQQILFQNTYSRWYDIDNPIKSKDLYFKDLKFVEIDLKDSTSVKLKKIE
ncbi:hypothetical protein QWY99_15710 [Flavobacterium branchiarum]|uniref:Lipoprotein n=1 Tax=Flavobacterium branchiarum TaxID=1114870 RepID=A0ABV5FLK8_9FLAO|nr:hypothetical protein [Flavobacterium branchiarum]MDN3674487.1 hypothetical protein [Flavobacterium branchiarum]